MMHKIMKWTNIVQFSSHQTSTDSFSLKKHCENFLMDANDCVIVEFYKSEFLLKTHS